MREERKLRWKKDAWKLNVLRRAPIAADNSDNGAATPWGVFSLLFFSFCLVIIVNLTAGYRHGWANCRVKCYVGSAVT